LETFWRRPSQRECFRDRWRDAGANPFVALDDVVITLDNSTPMSSIAARTPAMWCDVAIATVSRSPGDVGLHGATRRASQGTLAILCSVRESVAPNPSAHGLTTIRRADATHWIHADLSLWAVSDLNDRELGEFVQAFELATR